MELVLWSGVKITEAVALKAKTEREAEHCEREQLCEALDHMHEMVQDRATHRRLLKARRNAKNPGIRFNVGDLVIMVSASKNAAHPVRPSKIMVKAMSRSLPDRAMSVPHFVWGTDGRWGS